MKWFRTASNFLSGRCIARPDFDSLPNKGLPSILTLEAGFAHTERPCNCLGIAQSWTKSDSSKHSFRQTMRFQKDIASGNNGFAAEALQLQDKQEPPAKKQKTDFVRYDDYVEQCENFFSPTRAGLRKALLEWADAGFPPDAAPSPLICCVFLNQAALGTHFYGVDKRTSSAIYQRLQGDMIKALLRHLGSSPFQQVDPQVLGVVASCIARLGGPHLYEKEVDFLYKAMTGSNVDKLTFHTIKNLLTGLYTSQHHYGDIGLLESRADALLSASKPVHVTAIAFLLKGFACVNYKPVRLLRNPKFCEANEKILHPQDYLAMQWSLAAFDECGHPLMKRLWPLLSKHWRSVKEAPHFCMQVHQALLAMKNSGHAEVVTPIEQSEWYPQLRRAAISFMRGTKEAHVAAGRQNVVRILNSLGIPGESPSLGYGIPIDVLIPSIKVALEFDPSSHFFRNRPDLPLGKTMFKRRLIEGLGLRLISIPLREWARLGSLVERRKFIIEKLEVTGRGMRF